MSMNLNELGKTVAKYAPLLGSVIPVPGAAAVGNLIGMAFGGSTDDPKDLIEKINASSDAAIKLKEIEANCSVQLQQIAANVAVANVNADVATITNAQNVQKETKSHVPSMLTYLLTGGFFVIMYALFHMPIPAGNEPTVYALIGSYTTVFLSCTAFWFGTSFSSQSKDKMIFNSNPIGVSK